MSDLEPGRYAIQATYVLFENSLQVVTSNIAYVNVSYPLFVNWSLDWEGFGVSSTDLDDIDDIATTFNMPVTQYFNPRIYIANQYSAFAVDPGTSNWMTNWVIERRNTRGDEIGLHIHMYPDLEAAVEEDYIIRNNLAPTVEETEGGVDEEQEQEQIDATPVFDISPSQGSKIVGIARDENVIHGYSEEELEIVFEWSVRQFEERGLGVPISFRSGAWMSGPQVLKALQDAGFKIDSTARTPGVLNPSNASSTPIPWNVGVTQKPYYPNVSNINSSASPTLSILEFPNNGADSYWFSQDDMINRFNENKNAYSNTEGIMISPQTVTYLSHPHSFKQFDSAKIRGTFEYIQQFRYELGSGPVVFATMADIYNEFDVSLFTNENL